MQQHMQQEPIKQETEKPFNQLNTFAVVLKLSITEWRGRNRPGELMYELLRATTVPDTFHLLSFPGFSHVENVPDTHCKLPSDLSVFNWEHVGRVHEATLMAAGGGVS